MSGFAFDGGRQAGGPREVDADARARGVAVVVVVGDVVTVRARER